MNKRLIEFDMLRGAAIIGVIAIHVTTAVITDHTSASAYYLSLIESTFQICSTRFSVFIRIWFEFER